MSWFILFLGVCSNAVASILIKLAVTEPRALPTVSEPISVITNWQLWFGLFLYGATFLFYALALTKLPLHIAHPVLTSGAVAMVAVVSLLIFKESFYWTTVLGITLIIVGVALIAFEVK